MDYLPSETEKLLTAVRKEVEQTPCAFLFYFDGVLASKTEDRIYELPEIPTVDRLNLANLSLLWKLNLEDASIGEKRYALYQAAAAAMNHPIDEGPALAAANLAAAKALPVYVFTLRSEVHAIDRADAFLEEKLVDFKEVYHLGRADLGQQVAAVVQKLPKQRILVFIDKENNAAVAPTLAAYPDCEIFSIDNTQGGIAAASLQETVQWVLDRGAARKREKIAGRAEQLKLALEHGRGMFVYHAGQRHTALNYYFVALAAFLAGFVNLFKHGCTDAPIPLIIGPALGWTGVFLCLMFCLLDVRNDQLVTCDWKLLTKVDEELHHLTGIPEYEITKAGENALPKVRYRWLVKVILSLFAILFIVLGYQLRWISAPCAPVPHV